MMNRDKLDAILFNLAVAFAAVVIILDLFYWRP